jgi:hypothetical protein
MEFQMAPRRLFNDNSAESLTKLLDILDKFINGGINWDAGRYGLGWTNRMLYVYSDKWGRTKPDES